MKNELITRVMTPAPATLSPRATTEEAERLMREHACHHIPIVEENRLVGLLSARDLLKALVLRGDSINEPPLLVGAIMNRTTRAIPQTATLLDAAKALTDGGFHALPVVAPSNAVAGIVTSSDLIETLVDGLKHPIAADRSLSSTDDTGSANELPLLRAVYRAALSYLESGRGELEHSRLQNAVDRVRDAHRPTSLEI